MTAESYLPTTPTDDAEISRGDTADAQSGPRPPIGQQLIQETRNQIRSLVDEITALAETHCKLEEFYEGFLTRTASALASLGGAIWRIDDQGSPRLEYHINLAQSGLTDDPAAEQSHAQLLQRVAVSGEATLVLPGSGQGEDLSEGNQTQNLLILGPLVVDQKVVGLVEMFQRTGSGPTTQRGYLRFVAQMCKVASGFLKNHQLRQYAERHETWQRLQQFAHQVHSSLNLKQTSYAIANESRRVLECDRVSLARPRGGKFEVHVVSGLDALERRADQVKKLSRLVSAVAAAGQPMDYRGDDSDLSPQIEVRLHEYLDVSHAKTVIIRPLFQGEQPESSSIAPSTQTRQRVVGALVVEQLGNDQVSPIVEERLEAVVAHSRAALTNALLHSEAFLSPLLTWLGHTSAVQWTRRLPAILIVAGIVATLIAALFLVPYPFQLSATGKLIPERQQEIFAQIDGVLQQVLVPADPDEIVQADQLLAVMSNNDLLVQIQNLHGQLRQAAEEAKKLQRAQHARMSPADHRMLEGDLAEALEAQRSAQRQLDLALQKADLLNVRSPARGRVINWQPQQDLLHRPVQRGQNLMTVVDPETAWQIELECPERRVGHLLQRSREASEPILVTFTLASHPGRQFRGHVLHMDRQLAAYSDQGNAMRVKVEFDQSQIAGQLLRTGTRVTAQIHAGQRSLGYVWFHELFETIQETWLVWL